MNDNIYTLKLEYNTTYFNHLITKKSKFIYIVVILISNILQYIIIITLFKHFQAKYQIN